MTNAQRNRLWSLIALFVLTIMILLRSCGANHIKFWILALPQRYKHTQWLENNAFIVLSKIIHLASTNKKSFPGNWWQNDLFVTSASPLHQDSASRSLKTSGKWGSRYWWNSSPLVTPLTYDQCQLRARHQPDKSESI